MVREWFEISSVSTWLRLSGVRQMVQSLSSLKLSASYCRVRKYSYSPRKRLGIKNSGLFTWNIIIAENDSKRLDNKIENSYCGLFPIKFPGQRNTYCNISNFPPEIHSRDLWLYAFRWRSRKFTIICGTQKQQNTARMRWICWIHTKRVILIPRIQPVNLVRY